MGAFGWGIRTFAVAIGLLAALIVAAVVLRQFPLDVGIAEKRTIAVKGSASVSVAPSEVEVSGGVTTSAKSASDALDQNNVAMARVLDGLQADGIGRDKISTTGFSIAPQHPPLGNDSYSVNELVTTGYVVKNSINVRLPANEYSGKLLDRIIRLGATNIDSVSFIVRDASKYIDQVRADASLDARKRAEVAAKPLGVRVGNVVSIDRIDMPTEPVYAARFAPRTSAPPPPPVEIMQRAQEFSADVTVVFELE